MREWAKKYFTKKLEKEAIRVLRRYEPKIVAIAGSIGKTSTKYFAAEVLRQKYRVLAHSGSYNTDIGVPLSILDMDTPNRLYSPAAWLRLIVRAQARFRRSYPYDVLVLEVGTDHPGDIEHVMRYLHPEIGVITAVTPEHMEGFGSMEAVLEEEFKLAHSSKVLLLNANDPLLSMKRRDVKKAKVKTYGVDKGDYWFSSNSTADGGRLAGQLHLETVTMDVQLQVVARQTALGVVGAAAIGELMRLSKPQILAGVQAIKPVHGRMNPLPGHNRSLIIDDSYNSSPDAATAALNTLYGFSGKRKIAVLGSMNELGDYSQEAHQNVGRFCNNLNLLVTIGDEAKKHLAPAARNAGLAASKIRSFKSPYQAGRFVRPLLKKGDVVLVKGSQNGVFSEEATKLLLANTEDSVNLVRQSNFWTERKHQQFGSQ